MPPVLQGYSDSVTWLLQQGADANCSNQGGSTPLHSAVSHGQANAMQLLVYMGLADTLAEDECGETPMGLAQSQGHTGLAQTLETAQYVSCMCLSLCPRESMQKGAFVTRCTCLLYMH